MYNKEISNVVKYVLYNNPASRSDDMILIYDVFKIYIPKIDHISLKSVLYNHKAYGLPSIASIIRYRRALQRDYPELGACDKVKEARSDLEAEYHLKFKK